MKMNGWQKICLIFLLLLASFNLGGTGAWAAEDHVPDGISMQEGFNPGFGDTLGIFTKTVGRVLLIHDKDTLGYWAEKDRPLYMKDLVVTPEQGLALMQFLDDSTISVAEDSELVINRFIFDPDKFDRSTFISMDSGRARFWVKKLKGYTRSEFKVKTKTLIAGVRGSDFVLLAAKDFSETEVIALDDTILEIVSLAALNKIVTLRSLEKVRVVAGQEASPIEKVTPEEAARLKSQFPMPFDKLGSGAAGLLGTDRTIAPGMAQKLRPSVALIPQDDLEDPDPAVEEKTGEQPPGFDEIGGDLATGPGFTHIDEQEEEILEDEVEDKITEEVTNVDLPPLPETP